ncbi:UNVERIFIED_CONTAM: Soluble starch synthase 3, chloroplastic/amyloplastic [Sesamum radiatum]|uniref:starch synthase n=1 Tax=Sesamum radiatum TaxID=300843 RepID=A0AAW2T4Y0_SESRA
MEVPLPLQRTVLSERTQSKIKPFLRFLPGQSLKWKKDHVVAYRITASADFSRKRQKKISVPGSKGSTPRGFVPRTQVPTNTQRRDQKTNEEKEGPDASSSQEFGGPNAKTPKLKVGYEEEGVSNINLVAEVEESDDESNGVVGEVVPFSQSLFDNKIGQSEENGRAPEVGKHVMESKDAERITKYEEKVAATSGTDVSVYGRDVEVKKISSRSNEAQWRENMKKEGSKEETSISKMGINALGETDSRIDETENTSNSKDKRSEDHFLKLKLESEEIVHKEALARLAEDNFRKGNKLFYYPELFHVPKEAYKIDFVFYNGHDVYDNNDKQDFCITVEGGMDVFDFEDFLLEEKRKEQEELVRQKAEKERQAEEQRRIEAERAASEADIAQAREEVEKRKGALQELMKKATPSSHSVWYIWPSEFECNDMIKLYYNRSSGPLSDAKDIWLHGGHNGWKDGLSIISKLIKAENKGGDWWYAEVTIPDRALVLDWVFADGPPQQAITYDNNGRQDFHAIVPNSIPEELYWAEEEQQIYKRLQAERRLREEAARAKAEKTARLKAETKEKTLKTFLLSQKHIVYTDPLDVQAGSTVTLFL